MKLTVKKKDGAIKKGAKIGAAVGALSGLAAKNPVGGRIGGTLASTVGGAVAGSAIGSGVKAIKNRKKKGSFSNNELTEFKDFTVNASFPKIEIKETKPKTAVELAYEKIKNRDKLPDCSSSLTDNI